MRLYCVVLIASLCCAPISLRVATAASAGKQGQSMSTPQDEAINKSIQHIDDLQKSIKKMDADMDKIGTEIKKVEDAIAKKEQEKPQKATPKRSSTVTDMKDALQQRTSVDKDGRRSETDINALKQSLK